MSVLGWRNNFSFFFFFIVRMLKICSLSKLQTSSTWYCSWQLPCLRFPRAYLSWHWKPCPLDQRLPSLLPSVPHSLSLSLKRSSSVSLTVVASWRTTLSTSKAIERAQGWVKSYTDASLESSVILWIKPVFRPPRWCTSYCCHQQNDDHAVLVLSKRKNSVVRHTQF